MAARPGLGLPGHGKRNRAWTTPLFTMSFFAMGAHCVFFGFTVAWQLTLKPQSTPAPVPFRKSVLCGVRLGDIHPLNAARPQLLCRCQSGPGCITSCTNPDA